MLYLIVCLVMAAVVCGVLACAPSIARGERPVLGKPRNGGWTEVVVPGSDSGPSAEALAARAQATAYRAEQGRCTYPNCPCPVPCSDDALVTR